MKKNQLNEIIRKNVIKCLLEFADYPTEKQRIIGSEISPMFIPKQFHKLLERGDFYIVNDYDFPDIDMLEYPKHPDYRDIWNDMLSHGVIMLDGVEYRLEENNGLWIIPMGAKNSSDFEHDYSGGRNG